MSKCLLAALLRNAVQDLNRLRESLEDESRLCFPNKYDCSKCLREIIANLRRIEKEARRLFDSRNAEEVSGYFKRLGTKERKRAVA